MTTILDIAVVLVSIHFGRSIGKEVSKRIKSPAAKAAILLVLMTFVLHFFRYAIMHTASEDVSYREYFYTLAYYTVLRTAYELVYNLSKDYVADRRNKQQRKLNLPITY